jgi:predicted PurR-regulated permease PerM
MSFINKNLGDKPSLVKPIAVVIVVLLLVGGIYTFLGNIGIQNLDNHIGNLKSIQSIRSAGVAHRKGSEYQKVISRLKLNTNDFQTEFDSFLKNIVNFLKEIPVDYSN